MAAVKTDRRVTAKRVVGKANEAAVGFELGQLDSPIGTIRVVVRAGVLCALSFDESWPRDQELIERRFGTIGLRPAPDPGGVVTALRQYFSGDLGALDRLSADPGGTPFQARVWKALRTVPPGRTLSYAHLAQRIASPSAVRAVGAANGANPIPVVIPCHRIIGANGQLVGYGGGLDRKTWLLRHEGVHLGLPLET